MTGPPGQPDISYHPDRAKWEARTARRLAEDPTLSDAALPEGFPKQVDSPMVWEGKDWTDESQWVYNLSIAELKEINEAVTVFHSKHNVFHEDTAEELIAHSQAKVFKPD
jgi:hypothetical protein